MKSIRAPKAAPSTPPRQVLMTRSTPERCAADYQAAAHLRTKPAPEVAR